MKKVLFLFIAAFWISCSSKTNNKAGGYNDTLCSAGCEVKGKGGDLTCSFTSAELQKRKQTVLSSLQKQVLEKKELENGYAFKFNGSDKMIDELTDFVKSERQCCNFFTFNLSMSGDTRYVWFEIKGPGHAKEFIKSELEL